MLLASDFSPLFGRLNQLPWSYFYQFMSDLPEYSIFSFDWDLQDYAEASRYRGLLAVKGWSVMLMVPGLPKDTPASSATGQLLASTNRMSSASGLTLSRVSCIHKLSFYLCLTASLAHAWEQEVEVEVELPLKRLPLFPCNEVR